MCKKSAKLPRGDAIALKFGFICPVAVLSFTPEPLPPRVTDPVSDIPDPDPMHARKKTPDLIFLNKNRVWIQPDKIKVLFTILINLWIFKLSLFYFFMYWGYGPAIFFSMDTDPTKIFDPIRYGFITLQRSRILFTLTPPTYLKMQNPVRCTYRIGDAFSLK